MAGFLRLLALSASCILAFFCTASQSAAGEIKVRFFLVPERLVCSGLEAPFTECAPISGGCNAEEQRVCADRFIQRMASIGRKVEVTLSNPAEETTISRFDNSGFFSAITEYVDGPDAPYMAVVAVFDFLDVVPHEIRIFRDHDRYPRRKVRRGQGNRYFYWMNARFMHFEEQTKFEFTFDGETYKVQVGVDR